MLKTDLKNLTPRYWSGRSYKQNFSAYLLPSLQYPGMRSHTIHYAVCEGGFMFTNNIKELYLAAM